MPTYDYKCDACGHTFEKFQSITAGAIRKCPKCGKRKVRRLLGTGAGLIFKGSGFYSTDYRSESYKSAAKADSGGSSSGDSAAAKTETKSPDTSTKSDAKPAASSNDTKAPAGAKKHKH